MLDAGERRVILILLEENTLALDGLLVTAQKRRQPVQKCFIAAYLKYLFTRFFEEDNRPVLSQGAYGLLNVRTGLRTRDDWHELAFYASNLLNERYIIDAGNIGDAFGIPTFIPGPPRLMSLQISASFP